MEELLKEILQEMKWHTKQNDKMIELLGKLRQPCGEQGTAQIKAMMKILESIPGEAKKINPALSAMLEQVKAMVNENKK